MKNKARRIIPLTPCSTETLFFLGFGPKVVRISHNPPKGLPEKPIYKKVHLAVLFPFFCIDFILDINYSLIQHLVENAMEQWPGGRS
jgi:hypothetical protein